jgi:hypothetical protein
MLFRKKPIKIERPETGKIIETGKATIEYGHRTVKYVELFGSMASGSLGAGLSGKVIDWKVPDGHCAELYAIGVQPDLGGSPPTSNLKETAIGYDEKLTDLRFLTNHMGKNFLPYGDPSSKQPIRLLDFPMTRGNLTTKYDEGMKVQVWFTGKGALQSEAKCRVRVLLYEAQDVAAYYGARIDNFSTLPGGVKQERPILLYTTYVEDYTTAGRGQWEDAISVDVKDFEQIQLTHIGVVSDANANALKIYDHRLKWEAPEYEPYFVITSGYNSLPFGDDDEFQPTQKLPSVIAHHLFTNTTMKVQVRDKLASSKVTIHLLGVYRRVR